MGRKLTFHKKAFLCLISIFLIDQHNKVIKSIKNININFLTTPISIFIGNWTINISPKRVLVGESF